MKIDGVEFNPETNREIVERRIVFTVAGLRHELVMRIPFYIWERVSWERVNDETFTAAQNLTSEAIRAGTFFSDAGQQRVRGRVLESAKSIIRGLFDEYQFEAGNSAWERSEDLKESFL